MKGIELPVNVLVIIAIAVLVLLGMIALYTSGILSLQPVEVANLKNSACLQLADKGCLATNTETTLVPKDITGDGIIDNSDNFQTLCENYYSIAAGDTAACIKLCPCAT